MAHDGILTSLYYAVFGDTVVVRKSTYWRNGLIAVGIIALLVGSFFVYRWYAIHREQAAQKTFAECFVQYERAASGDGAVTWPMVADMWQRGYDMHKNSHLAPYFLASKAKALVEDKQIHEASILLDEVVALLPKNSPLYYEYKTQAALLAADDPVAEQWYAQKVAENDQYAMPWFNTRMSSLAYDLKNPQQDVALYYLGLHSWMNNDLEQAAIAWQKLVELSSQSDSPSPWAQLIEDKYQQLADSGYPRHTTS